MTMTQHKLSPYINAKAISDHKVAPPPQKKKKGKKVSCICNKIKCFPFLVNIKIFFVNLINFTNLILSYYTTNIMAVESNSKTVKMIHRTLDCQLMKSY